MAWLKITCPYCRNRIPLSAIRCPDCRSVIPHECGETERRRLMIWFLGLVGFVVVLVLALLLWFILTW